VRLVAIGDTNAAVADDTAKRYGYQRAEYDWHAIAEAPDIDAVSVVVANHLHREIVEGLLAAGKHVLCEKPLAGSLADAEAMVAAAEGSDRVTAVGYTYRRSPAIEQIRRELAAGTVGELVHFNGHYWCDYALDPTSPITWRYRGGPGGCTGRRRQHLLTCRSSSDGPITEVSGAAFATLITERPVPIGVTYGHTKAAVSDERAPVEERGTSPPSPRRSNAARWARTRRHALRTTCPTDWPSNCSPPEDQHPGTFTAPVSSRFQPTTCAAISADPGGC
jgi:hypothetical protein